MSERAAFPRGRWLRALAVWGLVLAFGMLLYLAFICIGMFGLGVHFSRDPQHYIAPAVVIALLLAAIVAAKRKVPRER